MTHLFFLIAGLAAGWWIRSAQTLRRLRDLAVVLEGIGAGTPLDRAEAGTRFAALPDVTRALGAIEDRLERHDRDRAESLRRLESTLDELRRSQNQTVKEERVNAMRTMAEGIVHDLNNAIAPILGFSELLLGNPGDLRNPDKIQRYLGLIRNSAQDAARVIHRLRLVQQQRPPDVSLVPLDLAAIVRDAVTSTQPQWKYEPRQAGRAVGLETEIVPVPPVLGCDLEIREALTQLILNAVDALPYGGRILVTLRPEGEGVCLKVRDTGVGMSEEVRARCLEPFFSTRTEVGSGMGLCLVQDVVTRHRGELEIDSRPGGGTTVSLRFPSAPPSPPPAPLPAEPGRPRPLHILLVDDDPPVREVIRTFLAHDGHQVTTATDGREGWNILADRSFDLLIVDGAMPEMSGSQLAVSAKSLQPNVPLILLTGFGELFQDGAEPPPGVDLVLGKPISMPALQSAIAQLMASRPQEVTPGVPSAPRTITVLMVDDEESILVPLKVLLERRGFQVWTARSAEEATRLYGESAARVDLLLTDVELADGSGPEWISALKVRDPHLRVLFMSGHSPRIAGGPTAGLATGEFIQKPFTPDELVRKLEATLAPIPPGGETSPRNPVEA